MKEPRAVHGHTVFHRGSRFRVVGIVIAPDDSVLLAPYGVDGPGVKLDPKLWAAASWDWRQRAWLVPDTAAP